MSHCRWTPACVHFSTFYGFGNAAMQTAFRIVTRKGADSQHPVLVFDRDHRLHFPLTIFATEAVKRSSVGTARTYLNVILPFFSWLETDEWQKRSGRCWDDTPEQIRLAVQDYLIARLKCKLKEHYAGFQLVSLTAGTRSTVRVFLSGFKLYYRVMRAQGLYRYDNPLVDSLSTALTKIEECFVEDDSGPRMPQISGVAAPRKKQRLSDSYFKLVGEVWIPQVIDDPHLPARILAGGQKIGWRLREQCIARILFESGGRVSEVVGQTLGDWVARGVLQETQAFSKGSHGKRVKFLRFSAATAKLLRRYCDTERSGLDLHHYALDDYLQAARSEKIDLYQSPLFLSRHRTPLAPKTFRDCYWNPACRAAGIEADVHQARHWYVTQIVRSIYEMSRSEAEVQRRLRELIEYMGWKSGWETLEAYQHYFDPQRHAEIQDQFHQRLDASLQQSLRDKMRTAPDHTLHQQTNQPLENKDQAGSGSESDADLDFLFTLGGQRGNGESSYSSMEVPARENRG
jgi:integrase